jgi:radical SAM superfamily enzyme YgiQ (UPF0313 family)
MDRRKVVFVNPHPPERHGEESISVIVQMPLNLAYLAALTPPEEWERDLIDETVELALDEQGEPIFDADLVAITSLTYQSPRAYEIATACRRRGMRVVMGGIHASAMVAEAQRHADAVCIGEAEVVWRRILDDFSREQLQPLYDGGLPSLELVGQVHPDREFCREKYGYKYSSIVTTKGCPFRCEFCSVPVFQGRQFRERPVEDVWAEMESTNYKGLMLAEDNFYGYSKRANDRARRLFQGMVERRLWKDWFGFSTLATGQDLVMLDAMAKSGCFGFLIGLESNSEDVLKKMVKDVNLRLGVARMADSIKNIHDHGMIVWGSVIFGADGDDRGCFRRMVDYVLENSLDVLTYGISTPLPNTPMHKRLLGEGRIFRAAYPDDWFHYGTDHVTYKLEKMTLEEFIEGMHYVYDHLYTKEALRARFRHSLQVTGNPRTALFAYRVGQDWQRVFQQILQNLHALYDSGAYPAEGGSVGIPSAMQPVH